MLFACGKVSLLARHTDKTFRSFKTPYQGGNDKRELAWDYRTEGVAGSKAGGIRPHHNSRTMIM